MKIIYEPKGRAREYGELAANLYRGCTNGCIYCYVPNILRMSREEFHADAGGDLDLVSEEKLSRLLYDAAKLQGDQRNVFLSFTTDPYQPREADEFVTERAIKILNGNDIGVTILTKSGKLPLRDFHLLAAHPRNQFGVTLTTHLASASEYWEPGADHAVYRINALAEAKRMGIKTWVSFEPVVDPETVLHLVDLTHGFVDHYKVGKLNYHPHAKTIDWPKFREQVIERLEYHRADCYIKQDLREAV